MEIYIVKYGDSLWSISNKFGISAKKIMDYNNITTPDGLVVGQALLILYPDIIHIVSSGDTLYSIANEYGIMPVNLIQNNPEMSIDTNLYVGQEVIISFKQPKKRNITINGYTYPHIQPNLLEKTLPYLTTVTIFGYGFNLDGSLIEVEDQPIIDLARKYNTASVMLISSINEFGTFSTERANLLFNNLYLQNTVIDNIVEVMIRKGYVGLDIDFEFIESSDAQAYLNFISNVTERLHQYGFFVNVDLAPKVSDDQKGLLYESHNYREIGKISDFVLVMTYEWGYTYGPPMAVAPLDQVRRVIEYAVTVIPENKIFMGIPNYGYIWSLPYVKNESTAVTIGNDYAITVAKRNNAVIQFDDIAKSPFFEFIDENNTSRIAWFEDVRSIQQKFNLIDEKNLYGAGYWNIMRAFNQNWFFIASNYDINKIV